MTHGEKAQELAKKYKNPRNMVGPYEFVAYEAALEAMKWKDEQYLEEKRELLGLVKMLSKDETNQTIIEDLIALLEP